MNWDIVLTNWWYYNWKIKKKNKYDQQLRNGFKIIQQSKNLREIFFVYQYSSLSLNDVIVLKNLSVRTCSGYDSFISSNNLFQVW